jgi:tetratricopeptide (TPR) repeat protein
MVENNDHMRPRLRFYCLTLALCCWTGAGLVMAQPGASVNLVKPKKYENRTLASERPTDKPLNPVSKFNQDLNTVFNFHFNANNKLNEIIARAKMSQKDDFTKLLPFYNFTLEATAQQKQDLDSVILRCNDAILLHDLRSNWVDDMYLLMGKGYFYRKTFDSAAITFQYVNYAFQPRKKDEIGYEKFIGSNLNEQGNAYTVSTREKGNTVTQAVMHTPSRNESILWLLRTLIETGDYNNSASLIQTLRHDRNFPARLDNDLEELQAYWFYRNRNWDSTANHLVKALDNAANPLERARWEYLVAQLYERSGKVEEAGKYYDKCITHTTDPIMEAYARINQIRLVSGKDEEERIRKDLQELDHMARKSKYEEYRPIIYYAAAQLELQRKTPDAAMVDLSKSIKSNFTDPALKNKAFLQLGDLAFSQRKYAIAHDSYDSLDLADPEVPDPDLIRERNIILAQVIYRQEQVNLEDSLQKIAAMPEAERTAYIKGLSKKLRKEKGMKEEEDLQGGYVVDMNHISTIENNTPVDLFTANNPNNKTKGDWYFYNAALKGQGFRTFQQGWGNRPNLDNWRRLSAVKNQMATAQRPAAGAGAAVPAAAALLPTDKRKNPEDISAKGLLASIPLTPESLQASNDSLEKAYHALGRIFQDKLGDCDETVHNFESLLNRFPNTAYQEEALFALTYCYGKMGNTQKAAFYKGHLSSRFGQSKYLRYLNNPKAAQEEAGAFKAKATNSYNEIYNLFIAGDFDKALQLKKRSDSSYGEQFWSPQLLYIESLYYVKQRQDSLAISTLTKIGSLYPDSKLVPKANNMVDVLKRRSEIEGYLTDLKVERKKDDSVTVLDDTPAPKAREVVVKQDKPMAAPPVANRPAVTKTDTTRMKAPVSDKKAEGYTYRAASPYMVMLLLDKVDIVYVTEARNALGRFNRESYAGQNLEVTTQPLDDNRKMVLVATFSDVAAALEYYENARSKATSDLFPWLPAEKYGFLIISADNLETLKTKKDMDNYRKFLKESLPGKF